MTSPLSDIGGWDFFVILFARLMSGYLEFVRSVEQVEESTEEKKAFILPGFYTPL